MDKVCIENKIIKPKYRPSRKHREMFTLDVNFDRKNACDTNGIFED